MREEFKIPDKWYIPYHNKEEFEILKKFYKKNWVYSPEGDRFISQHKEGENACIVKKGELLSGYTKIAFSDFSRYILRDSLSKFKIGDMVKISKEWHMSKPHKVADVYYTSATDHNYCYRLEGSLGWVLESKLEKAPTLKFSLYYDPLITADFLHFMESWCIATAKTPDCRGYTDTNITNYSQGMTYRDHHYYNFDSSAVKYNYGLDNNDQGYPNRSLEEVCEIIGYSYAKLVGSTTTESIFLEDFCIKINNSDESAMVQLELFSLEYYWASDVRDRKKNSPKYTDQKYIFVYSNRKGLAYSYTAVKSIPEYSYDCFMSIMTAHHVLKMPMKPEDCFPVPSKTSPKLKCYLRAITALVVPLIKSKITSKQKLIFKQI